MNTTNVNSNKNGKGSIIFVIILIVLILSGLGSCGGGSSYDRTCAWCNGTGYNGNGATNATEYVLKKTPCKHCNGSGTY